LTALIDECRDQGRRDIDVLRFIERRIDLLIAIARCEVEERREQRLKEKENET
jgi:hypothetical protein